MIRKAVLPYTALLFLTACVTAGTPLENTNLKTSGDFHQTKQENAPNQHGWDDNNCALIMADGHCAHPTSINILDTQMPTTPNANGWNSSNCAHITADGGCANEL